MSMIHRFLTVGLVGALVGVAVAADDATQAVKAGALSFKAPASWKKETPKSSMRQAQMKIEPTSGDTEAAELVVFAFPNGAGSVESNIDRWEKQFVDADKKTPKAKVEKKKGINVDVTRVEVSGRYVAAVTPGAAERNDKANYRLLGAIVETKDTGYFFKLTGPDKTVAAASKGFDTLVESMKLDK
jgi:uncharacterized cupredoxin-like copper-binding protein